MEPVYLDLHIHSSENPDKLNSDYNVELLLKKIKEYTNDSKYLISLTDHNIINKSAYMKLIELSINVLLGVELHISYYEGQSPYHCHIYFDIEKITEDDIDDINLKLQDLYPNKTPTKEANNIPHIEDIVKSFDQYNFILIPHGGQKHSTFNKSIPDGIKFDNTLERSIYYNQFDGFSSRGDSGLEETLDYFKRLGINDFINLVTGSDNYNLNRYPEAKSKDAKPFVPTWMLALPNFNGLRLSLSESSRLVYGDKPDNWSEYISKVKLKNEYLNIDVKLTPGLNVVIGGSSTGKTLFVDSIYKKLNADNFKESDYLALGVEDIQLENPSGVVPHYISQNYIMKIIDSSDTENQIDDIEIIKRVFPEDKQANEQIRKGLSRFKKDLGRLIESVKSIESERKVLSKIPIFTRLMYNKVESNVLEMIEPNSSLMEVIEYPKHQYETHMEYIKELRNFSKKNPFSPDICKELEKISNNLDITFKISTIESSIRKKITDGKNDIEELLTKEDKEQQTKKKNFQKLLKSITKYVFSIKDFYSTLENISDYSIAINTKEIESMGHTLYIENSFKMNKSDVIEIMNKYLNRGNQIASFDNIIPEILFKENYKKKAPKVKSYSDFIKRIYDDFEQLNRRVLRIITKDGRDFNNLSAGWKTSIILDLILGYQEDEAPIIIDQPEDNLATKYINTGLINAIKKIKDKKQIILVSHNATIPMLGDAQNIVLCEINNKIQISSSELEGKINNKLVLDYIAEITDGGKPSIKKRVKKYNLKRFKE